MKAWLGVVIGGLLLAGSTQALPAQDAGQSAQQTTPVTLTVDQAISKALANQPLLQQAQAAVEAARARVGEANSAYFPFVSGNASYNRLSDQSFALSALIPPQLAGMIPSSVAPLLNSPLSLVPVNV
ncbi:MAG TPA: TolC family protein, partial [Spirochaetia bacterium]|nr:TolC family protein [Spirochaetia bacterium]